MEECQYEQINWIKSSVSRSLKKGQGATSEKGNFNARQPMSKGQPLDAATYAKKNMRQGQIKNNS